MQLKPSEMPKISPSLRASWRRCPKQIFYRYIAGIQSMRTSNALAIGSAFHTGLETWRNDPKRDPMAAALTAAEAYTNKARATRIADDGYTHLQVMAYVIGYSVRYGMSDGGSKLAELQVFEEGDAETGFADCVMEFADGRRFVIDDKTTARFDDEQAMAWSLKFNDQLATYASALLARGQKIDGALYRQVKKTGTYPKKNETNEQYGERIMEIYTTDPSMYREFVITWTPEELKRLDQERERTNLDIVGWLDVKDDTAWPYNPNGCIGPYGPCDYVRLCANKKDATQRCFEPNGKAPIDDGSYQKRIWQSESNTPTPNPVGFDERTGEIIPG